MCVLILFYRGREFDFSLFLKGDLGVISLLIRCKVVILVLKAP